MSVVVSGIVPPGTPSFGISGCSEGDPTDSSDPTTAERPEDLFCCRETSGTPGYRMIAVGIQSWR